MLFLLFIYFCESTSAWLLFITILSSTSLVLSSLQSVANTQIKSLCGFMNPLREVDSEGVLKGAGRRHVEVSRPHFSEGGQGLFFVSHECSLVAVWPRQPLIVRARATSRGPAAHYRFFFFKPQGWVGGGGRGRGRGGGTHTDWL